MVPFIAWTKSSLFVVEFKGDPFLAQEKISKVDVDSIAQQDPLLQLNKQTSFYTNRKSAGARVRILVIFIFLKYCSCMTIDMTKFRKPKHHRPPLLFLFF